MLALLQAEKGIRNNFEEYFEQSFEAAILADVNAKIKAVNKSVLKKWNLVDKEELLDCSILFSIRRETQKKMNRAYIKFLSTGLDQEFYTKDDRYLYKSRIIPMQKFDSSQGFIYIEQSKRLKNKTQKIKSYFLELFENLSEGAIIIDAQGRIKKINPVAEYICGITYNEFDENNLFSICEFYSLDEKKISLNTFALATNNKIIAENVEAKLISAFGAERYIEYSILPLFVKDSSDKEYLLLIKDLTDKYLIEKELKDSAKRFNLAQNAAKLGGLEFDKDGERIIGSEQAFKLLGLPRPTPFLSPEKLLSLVDENDRALLKKTIDNAIKFDAEFEFETKISRAYDKKEVYVLIMGKSEKGLNNRRSIFCSIQDISRRKIAEEEIKTLNIELENRVEERTAQLEDALIELKIEMEHKNKLSEELIFAQKNLELSLQKEKELNELKTQFVSMVSHEYRTPLTVILSSTYILERCMQECDEKAFQLHTSRIQESVKLMTSLLEDVLMLGRSDSGKTAVRPTGFDIADFLRKIIDNSKYSDRGKHDIVFHHENKSMPVFTDPILINHIMSNLLSNAAKYSDSGSKIKVYLSEIEDKIEIRVKDYGIGIPEDDLDKLFEPFSRCSNAGAISGTGLGLTIAKRLVETLGGVIVADSVVGEGSEFTVLLPKIL
jgi:PAS domain S-box-containing protein